MCLKISGSGPSQSWTCGLSAWPRSVSMENLEIWDDRWDDISIISSDFYHWIWYIDYNDNQLGYRQKLVTLVVIFGIIQLFGVINACPQCFLSFLDLLGMIPIDIDYDLCRTSLEWWLGICSIPHSWLQISAFRLSNFLAGAFYVGNGWVAGGCWDDYWWLLWIIPSFPTFSTSKFYVSQIDVLSHLLRL